MIIHVFFSSFIFLIKKSVMTISTRKIDTKKVLASLTSEDQIQFRNGIERNRRAAVSNELQDISSYCEFPLTELTELFMGLRQQDEATTHKIFEHYQTLVQKFADIVEPLQQQLESYTFPEDVKEFINRFCSMNREMGVMGLRDLSKGISYDRIMQRMERTFYEMNQVLIQLSQLVQKKLPNKTSSKSPFRETVTRTMTFLTHYGTVVYIIGFVVFEGYKLASTSAPTDMFDAIRKICVMLCVLNLKSFVFRTTIVQILANIAKTIADHLVTVLLTLVCGLSMINFNQWRKVVQNKYTSFAFKHIFMLLYLAVNSFIYTIYSSVCTIMTHLFAKGVSNIIFDTVFQIGQITSENLQNYLNSLLGIFGEPLYMVSIDHIVAQVKEQLQFTQSFLWKHLQGFFGALNPLSWLSSTSGSSAASDALSQVQDFKALAQFNQALSMPGQLPGSSELVEASRALIFSKDPTTGALVMHTDVAGAVASKLGETFTQKAVDETNAFLATTWKELSSPMTAEFQDMPIDKYYAYALEMFKKPNASTTVETMYMYIYGTGLDMNFATEYAILFIEWFIVFNLFYFIGLVI
jgi:hypothetical protein